MTDMKILILAGGRGMRLWPLSRAQKPKQFQKLISNKTMLQETALRLLPEFVWKDIFVSTNVQYKEEVKKELPKLPQKNIIVEPMSRERVAAILLWLAFSPTSSALEPVAILPSDHSIKELEVFKKALLAGGEFIKKNPGWILTFGEKPSFPDTGLGYIKKGKLFKQEEGWGIYCVDMFREKPNLKRTRAYLKEGNYFWNTAIYILTPALLKKQVRKFVPDNFLRYQRIKKAAGSKNFKGVLEEEYAGMDKASLEFSVLENYNRVAVMPVDWGWSDVGSWTVLKDCLSEPGKNYAVGNHIDIDSKNVLVYGASDDTLVASVGVKDLIIAVTDDIVLVCSKKHSQKVKQLIEKLEKDNQVNYL